MSIICLTRAADYQEQIKHLHMMSHKGNSSSGQLRPAAAVYLIVMTASCMYV
jgi:hypothetical protein